MTPEIYNSGKVIRYHCNPRMVRHMQTNADHQWGVTTIILLMYPDPPLALVRAAMFHDSPELIAGDMPWPVKAANPAHAKAQDQLEADLAIEMGVPRPELTETEARWLHFADRLESYLHMELYGEADQWGDGPLQKLMAQADELGAADRVRELINA